MNTMDVTVRFAETDALGHVNNTSYFIYMEDARLHLLKELGWNTSHKDWSFVLVSTKCDFINQAYFDQILRIDTSIQKVGTKIARSIAATTTIIAIIIFFRVRRPDSRSHPGFVTLTASTFIMSVIRYIDME